MSELFRFYVDSPSDWGSWSCCPDKDAEKIRDNKAYHMTVLAASQMLPEDPDEVKYAGDLWFDLDCSDLSISIREFNKLLDTLQSLGADLRYCLYWASGSKGFHAMVPAVMFGHDNRKAVRYLNITYKLMTQQIALRGSVTGLDMHVHNGKKGGMLRVENKLRADGRYKVPITLEEARAINVETYLDLVQAPREVELPPMPKVWPSIALGLGGLFQEASRSAAQIAKHSKHKAVPDRVLQQFGDSNHPKCMQWIAAGEKLKETTDWNQITLQFASYVAHVELSDHEHEYLCNSYASSTTSQRHNSVAARRNELVSKIGYATQGHVKFACAPIRAILTDNPCAGCPVAASEGGPMQTAFTVIDEDENGYFYVGSKGRVSLTDFTLRLRKVYQAEEVEDNRTFAGLECDYYVGGQRRGRMTLPGDIGGRLQEFRRTCASKGLHISATEELLLLIFNSVHAQQRADEASIDVVTKTRKIGLHLQYDEDGREIWTYVEPGWSNNNAGCANTFQFFSDSALQATIAKLFKIKDPLTPQSTRFLEMWPKLLSSNFPHLVAQMLGWNAAAQFKPRFRLIRNEFPILHLFGDSSAGKTRSAVIYSAVGGTNYNDVDPLQIGGASNYPIKEAVCFTTSVPVLLDEVNPSSMGRTRWLQAVQNLKSIYGGGQLSQGTIMRDKTGEIAAASIPHVASSPVIFMGTSQMEDAAGSNELKNRCLEIPLGEHCKVLYGRVFREIDKHSTVVELNKLARLLMDLALTIRQTEFEAIYDKEAAKLPEYLNDRSRSNYIVPCVGLALIARVLTDAGFDKEVTEPVWELQEQLILWLVENKQDIQARRSLTEIDDILQTLAQMAQLDASRTDRMVNGTHYMITDTTLFLQPVQAFTLYMLHKTMVRQTFEVHSVRAFMRMLKMKSYFLNYAPLPSRPTGLAWVSLSIPEITSRGIDISGFLVGGGS